MSTKVEIPFDEAFETATKLMEWIKQYRNVAVKYILYQCMHGQVTKCNILRWLLFKKAYYIVKNNRTEKEAKDYMLNTEDYGWLGVTSRIMMWHGNAEKLCEGIIKIKKGISDKNTIYLDIKDAEYLTLQSRCMSIEEFTKECEENKDNVDEIWRILRR